MKNNNPQAFPQQSIYRDGSGEEAGMTLLDYFAGQALIGFVSNRSNVKGIDDETITAVCYDIAELMLKEREKRL